MLDTELSSPEGILTLLGTRGVGIVRAEGILKRFSTIREIREATPEQCKGVVSAKILADFLDDASVGASFDGARREIESASAAGVTMLTPFMEGYPERLAGIDERPLVLYAMGDISYLERSVACVGTREPTAYGEAVTRRVTATLAEAGWAIVSGLARGVDHISHEVALECGVPTMAVLGCGMDMLTSDRQLGLAQRILDAGGGIVSEQAMGTEIDPWMLVRRNRIQCGSSAATFVMQSKPDGGTMQTARYALLQGRPLWAPMPPPAYAEEEACSGPRILVEGTGPELVAAIGAKQKEFVDLMFSEFGEKPVAKAIRGRDDYPSMLASLEETLSPQFASEPAFA